MNISPTFRTVLAIAVGIVSVLLVQKGLTLIWNANGVFWGPKNLPYAPLPQAGALSSAFIAGVMGPLIAVVLARRKAPAIWITFLIIGLSIDGFAAVVPMQPLPLWFRISWVSSVVFQVTLGILLGGLFIKQKS